MEITVLGSGTSQGVPMIAHGNPEHLDLDNEKNWRTRASIHVEMGGHHIQVDAGPEFRMQCLKNSVEWIDTFILTHGHADHIAGMDDLRRFCDLQGGVAMPVYTNTEGSRRIHTMYPYAILDRPRVRGYPAFQVESMPDVLELPGGTIRSFDLPHGSFQVLGLVFEERQTKRRCAYFTDCSSVPEEAIVASEGVDLLIVDGLRPQPHPSHMSISEAVDVALRIRAKQTYLTHIASFVDHETINQGLPEGVELAWDGLNKQL